MTEPAPRAVLVMHSAATFFMVRVIWFVQVVHDPLFARVGRDGFGLYESAHARRTGWVVALPMLAELLSAVLLLWVCPATVSVRAAGTGRGLVTVIWVSTRLLQTPCPDRLVSGFDPSAHRRLVSTSWLWTICWSLRGLLVAAMAYQSI